jgi:hypothetical protein
MLSAGCASMFQSQRCKCYFIGAVLLALVLNGCGGRSIPTTKVEGTITYNGQPIKQGTIAFHPLNVFEGSPRRIATGKISSEGTYCLSTFVKDDGVIPGEYKITIVSREAAKTFDSSDEEVAALRSFIPIVYANPDQSPLKETISSDAPEPVRVDFNLEGEVSN